MRTPSAVKTETAPPAATSASPLPAQTATPLSPEPPPTRYPGEEASKDAVMVLSLGLTAVHAVPASEDGMESCRPGVEASGSKGAAEAEAAAEEAASSAVAAAGAEAAGSVAFAGAAAAAAVAAAAFSASSFLGEVSTVLPSASPGRT